jgi:hypothetical protein
MTEISIDNVFFGVFSYFGRAILVCISYGLAKHFVVEMKTLSKWKAYFKIILAAVIVSLFFMSTYGTHSEPSPSDEYDGIFGSGETVEDFKPTRAERYEYGIIMFIVLLIPALIGTNKGLEEIRQYEKQTKESKS